jgi:7-cyano-7-deazaguanine synthase
MTTSHVLFSGGQDSTTCLAWAKARFTTVHTVAFDYQQRHRVELEAAAKVSQILGVASHQIIPINSLAALGGSALTSNEAVQAGVRPATGLPNTFVPGRNLVFLTLAAAYAYQLGIHDLVTGVCQTDYAGYPDCRQTAIDAVAQSIRVGMDFPVTIHSPLMDLSKADTVRLAMDLGAREALAWSHTCYNGQIPPCGTCPSCQVRAKGFADAGVTDPLLERLAHA